MGECLVTVIKTGDIYTSNKSLRSNDVTQTEVPMAHKVGVHVLEPERYPSTETQQQFMSAGKFRQRKETIERRLLYPDVTRNLTQMAFTNNVKIMNLIGL
jgi:hypothetical protein